MKKNNIKDKFNLMVHHQNNLIELTTKKASITLRFTVRIGCRILLRKIYHHNCYSMESRIFLLEIIIPIVLCAQ